MPSDIFTTRPSTPHDQAGGEHSVADADSTGGLLHIRDTPGESAGKELEQKGPKYWDDGPPRPPGLASTYTPGDEVGESCDVRDDGSICDVLNPHFITRHDDTVTSSNPETDIVAFMGSADLCGMLATVSDSESQQKTPSSDVRLSFVKAREQYAHGRTSCSDGLKTFTAHLEVLGQSAEISADESNLIKGAIEYLRPVEGTDATAGQGNSV